MLYTNTSIKTQKDSISTDVNNTHQLLVRGGYIKQVTAGIYTWLPLGLKVLRNIEKIIRKHMEKINYQEVLFPALINSGPYKKTGRWDDYGASMYKLTDRTGSKFLLAPTHEEMFTLLVKEMQNSYKNFPFKLYQIQTKYRDELRARAGFLRSKEFIMKDAYSFDLSIEELNNSYMDMRTEYIKCFAELGLDVKIVSAVSGAMGGSKSEEFLYEDKNGEDKFVITHDGSFSANIEVLIDSNPQLNKLNIDNSTNIIYNGQNYNVILKKATELGHIFQLGTKYSESLGLIVLNEHNKKVPVQMASYGIGVSRLVAVLANKYRVDNGFLWPENLSPYNYYIIVQPKNKEAYKKAIEIEKSHKEFDFLIDDRNDVSMGVKFKDADFCGVYNKIIIGKNFTNNNKIELRNGNFKKEIDGRNIKEIFS
jgi:prolyl-tRNA synthetase